MNAAGHRTAISTRRVDPVTLGAVAVVLLTLLVALLVHADGTPPRGRPPTSTPLTRADVICPPASGRPVAASLAGEDGSLQVTAGSKDPKDVSVSPFTPTRLPGSDDVGVVVTGRGAMAPGLLAGRFTSPLTAADCRAPVFDQWFTGVGAGPKHDSTLLLVNPDSSGALVDIEVYGKGAKLAAPESLRGRGVSGHQTLLLDLGTIIPDPDDLTIHVRTLRGRLSVALLDTVDRLDQRRLGVDLPASQDQPRRTNLLLGLPDGPGRRNLVLTNPGPDEGRATVQVVTETSTFVPEGLDDVVVPPGRVLRTTLGKQVGAALEDAGDGPGGRVVGLRIDSTVPMTADLLMLFGVDLTHATAQHVDTEPVGAVLPDASARLLLAGATGPGSATIRTWDAEGTELPQQRAELAKGAGAAVDLPGKARLVLVTPSRSPVAAVVLASDGSGQQRETALVQLRVPQTSGLVPQVTPDLP